MAGGKDVLFGMRPQNPEAVVFPAKGVETGA
jgi:hypothetical protein